MIGGFYIPAEQRTPEQQQALAFSDLLVQELMAADVLVIGAPIYNFGIPASLKSWVDLIARAGLTFKFSEAGPEGLLVGKKAYLVVTSGGVEVGSPYDLATPYLRQVLGFVGITDVEVISADRLNLLGEQPIGTAREAIRQIQAVAA
jgi:FMN-dependent NADH-azoreductase